MFLSPLEREGQPSCSFQNEIKHLAVYALTSTENIPKLNNFLIKFILPSLFTANSVEEIFENLKKDGSSFAQQQLQVNLSEMLSVLFCKFDCTIVAKSCGIPTPLSKTKIPICYEIS